MFPFVLVTFPPTGVDIIELAKIQVLHRVATFVYGCVCSQK